MQRRRRVDQLADRIVELETRLELLANFNGANDASLEDEIRAIYDLLPQYREQLRKETAKRAKFEAKPKSA
jgi:hypothetical protein